jgi:membrane glycosyltransferase
MDLYVEMMPTMNKPALAIEQDVCDIRLTPPLQHFSMVYRPPRKAAGFARPWVSASVVRRMIFFILVLSSTWLGGNTISTILGSEGLTQLTVAIICIFTVLFGWISATFWTALLGFITLTRHRDPFSVHPPPERGCPGIAGQTRIAVVLPVYNEDVPRIFGGLKVMYESLQDTGQLNNFDFFILSDTNLPEQRVREEAAWEGLCRHVDGFGKVFYRNRKIRINKKSGNISDFCRRWGTRYDYMITLDADSLMAGGLMVDMVKIMESRRDIGILQTVPVGFNQKSLISRINQFISHVYGPLLSAGSFFWQFDDAGFWGHNAIIRLKPFMEYCALPRLSGPPPFGGEILSHDFIEAALMRRAGWGVWLAYDLKDSYEELPPNLLDELKRDFRWCRGNIQHLRLIFMRGISLGHRLLFLNGNMFYFSAFLWLVLLVLMTAYAITDIFHKPQYFPVQHTLFPAWPLHYRSLSINLLQVTVFFLFFPKFLSVIWVILSRRQALFGGTMRLCLSVIVETVFSVFLAPVRMLFHSWFVAAGLYPLKFDWKKQSRHFKKISFPEAFRAHWAGCLLALAWTLVAFEGGKILFFWSCIITVPLLAAIPLSILTSDPKAGEFFQKGGLFLTPAETCPSKEITRLQNLPS